MYLILISFFFKIVQKMNKGRKGRKSRKIGVSLYACNFFICVYAHIFFYLLIHKKCHFIKHCALFVKIRGIIYINQSFTAGRNVSTLRPKLRPFLKHCALFVKHSNCPHLVLYFAGRMGSVAAIHWTLLNTQKSYFF